MNDDTMNPSNQQQTEETESSKKDNASKTQKTKSTNWSPVEEELLAKAWLHISQQPKVLRPCI